MKQVKPLPAPRRAAQAEAAAGGARGPDRRRRGGKGRGFPFRLTPAPWAAR